MELKLVASGTGLKAASSTHAVTRNAYLPFGATRGADQLATSRGWLGQVADTDTGLIYLNARYYDPVLARFISPDPLMNPGDPKTLDPYRYADNNPVMMTDPSGLYSNVCNGLTGSAKYACDQSAGHYKPIGSKSGFTPGASGSNAEGGGGGQRALPPKTIRKAAGSAASQPATDWGTCEYCTHPAVTQYSDPFPLDDGKRNELSGRDLLYGFFGGVPGDYYFDQGDRFTDDLRDRELYTSSLIRLIEGDHAVIEPGDYGTGRLWLSEGWGPARIPSDIANVAFQRTSEMGFIFLGSHNVHYEVLAVSETEIDVWIRIDEDVTSESATRIPHVATLWPTHDDGPGGTVGVHVQWVVTLDRRSTGFGSDTRQRDGFV